MSGTWSLDAKSNEHKQADPVVLLLLLVHVELKKKMHLSIKFNNNIWWVVDCQDSSWDTCHTLNRVCKLSQKQYVPNKVHLRFLTCRWEHPTRAGYPHFMMLHHPHTPYVISTHKAYSLFDNYALPRSKSNKSPVTTSHITQGRYTIAVCLYRGFGKEKGREDRRESRDWTKFFLSLTCVEGKSSLPFLSPSLQNCYPNKL